MLVMYANMECIVISDLGKEVKLIRAGGTIRRCKVGGLCGVKKQSIELNTFIASKKNVQEITKDKKEGNNAKGNMHTKKS